MAKREPKLVNQTVASEYFNCTRRNIGERIKEGERLYPATVMVGKKRMIDLTHPVAQKYRVAERASKLPTPEPTSGKGNQSGTRDLEVADEIRAFLDWTVRKVIDVHGTMGAFKDLLSAAKTIEEIHAKRMDSDRRTGELIARDYVKRHVLSLIERVFQRLLEETPVKLSYEIHGLCSTGATIEQVQEAIKAAISRELKAIKTDVVKAIRNASD